MKLLILGAGEYGHVVKELARNTYDTIDFLDDNSPIAIGKFSQYTNFLSEYKNAFVAIGNNDFRSIWINKLIDAGYTIPTIISERAYVSPSAILEKGVIVEPMASVHSFVKIETGTILSSGAVVNHHATVCECCHIDCNAVVGSGVTIPSKTHLNYGQTINRFHALNILEK